MNEFNTFIERLNGFSSSTIVFKIEAFTWYLHTSKSKERVTSADLISCFDIAHIPRPSNITSQLSALCAKKPARMLRDTKGFRLSAAARDDWARSYPITIASNQTTDLLQALLPKVTDSAQQAYLAETLVCYSHGAYRAAIVMAWNLAYSHVCDLIYSNHIEDFNRQMLIALKKTIVKRSDFEDFKESRIIEVARGAGILSMSSGKILKEKLDKRNTVAHPTSTKVKNITADEVIHDLVENILLRKEL